MSDEQNIALFEQNALSIMQNLKHFAILKKEIEDDFKRTHEELEKLCNEYNVKSIDNEFVKITFVEGSMSVSIDLKKLEAAEPELHAELLKDYPKTTTRKSYVRITPKVK